LSRQKAALLKGKVVLQRADFRATNQWEGKLTTDMNHKPDGYPSVSPYLVVSGANGTIEFLKRVFGAREIRRYPDENGRLMHSEVRVDDSVLMIADGAPGWPPVPAHVHIYVEDVDAVYRQAIDAGAESVQEPVKKDDDDKRGGVKDSGGTTWWIATKVS
jgi:uncharacterized glyoxalase superfamily protein PhnB